MRRWNKSRDNRSRRAGPLLLGMLLAPLVIGTALFLSPDWSLLAERAALASAMVNMPEGSIALLEEKFAGDVSDPASSGSNGETPPLPSLSDILPTTGESGGGADEPASSSSAADRTLTTPSPPKDAPEIPEIYRGKLLQENMAGSGSNLIARGAGLIRNYTKLDNSEVAVMAAKDSPIILEETDQPQVLIVHTHATESYEAYDSNVFDTRATWRSTDNTVNMVAVGDRLAKTLEAAGIAVVHDKTQHDYPSYNGAYERSAQTIKGYLKKYPTIKVVLDVHRDAILREEDVIVKPVAEIDGKKAAQLMIITGSEDGSMNVPKWKENLKFAAALQDRLEQDHPQLTRPIFFCYRKYNMDLTTGSLLLEFGSNANTLEECLYTAEMVGQSLGEMLRETLPVRDSQSALLAG